MSTFFEFLIGNSDKLLEQTLEHVGLTLVSLLLSCLLAIPLGLWIARQQWAAGAALGFAGVLQTIPSIALLGFMIPVLGIGVKPAIFALFLYAILPVLRNTYTGIRGVTPAVREAAVGMGMTPWQVLGRVELPLALPVIFAGIRTAAVINVGVAALAAYIGAGGLGEFIFGGIALNNNHMVLAGAIPAALLALLFDQGLGWIQQRPRGMRAGVALLLIPLLLLTSWRSAQLRGLAAAFDPEFSDRADGLPSIREQYDGLELNTLILNAGLLYRAVAEGEVDLISGYSTDGRVKAYDLKVLEDDRHAFPPYQCAALLHGPTTRAHPELVETLQLLTGLINDSTMTALNYQVDHEKRSPESVAADFLRERKLLRPDQAGDGPTVTIGSKLFTEQYILVEIFRQLIEGHTPLDVKPKPGLGGTLICYEALKAGEIDLYAEYTGTGFQVLLSPPDDLAREIITDAGAVYQYVSQTMAEEDDLRWLPPLGFNNTYALMTRAELARKKGWERISDLNKK